MDVLIIEDEQYAAERLAKLILGIDSNINIISTIDSIEKSVEWFRNNPLPDLIFLDIQLSDGLSFNIFNQVNINCPVIFTTAYDKYALKAFEINSIDYLLKPIDVEKLELSIKKFYSLRDSFIKKGHNIDYHKILSELSVSSKTYKTRYLINKGDKLLVINIERIAYFFSEDRLTYIITTDGHKYNINDSLDNVSDNVDPSVFFRISRKFIISINSISKISNHFNYKLKLDLNPKIETDEIIVSRQRVNEFKSWLGK